MNRTRQRWRVLRFRGQFEPGEATGDRERGDLARSSPTGHKGFEHNHLAMRLRVQRHASRM
jgi:hypothetical protein